MFNYTEKSRLYHATERRAAYTERLIYILDGAQKVGRIEVHTDLSGHLVALDHWKKERPILVEYIDPKRSRERGYDDTYHIDYCRTVAEGKKIFSDWYAQNSHLYSHGTPTDVKRLPASPDAEFYPTPSALAGQMAALVDWNKVETILEPSAGKGDLIEYAARCAKSRSGRYSLRSDFGSMVDCIEIDENLRHILTGKGYRVVHDDFLTFDTLKHYDLILMNPPFSNGDEHLLKALSLQKDLGGQIVCLLNAETIRNPYTNRRRVLLNTLTECGATIRFVSGAFEHAQRKTGVEVAIVYCRLPAAQRPSFIFDGLKKAQQEQRENESRAPGALVAGDWIEQIVASYNLEAKAGVALMNEYNALAPYIMSGKESYDRPLIQLTVKERAVSFAGTDTVNAYLRALRYKYWASMMNRQELTSRMTSQMSKDYHDKVNDLQDYDFSRYNIERVIREISGQLCRGVEESILRLFDKLSAKHSWYPECEKNVHYYNGWATNKAHKVNSKVILPLNGFYACWEGKKKLEAREFAQTISDIEQALAYLDGEGAISLLTLTAWHRLRRRISARASAFPISTRHSTRRAPATSNSTRKRRFSWIV